MIAVITVLIAFAAGYRFRSRLAANTAYVAAYLWAFVFQTLYLLLDALDPNSANPAFEAGVFPLSYGLVTLGIFGVGLGLVEAGHRLATRRAHPRMPRRPTTQPAH